MQYSTWTVYQFDRSAISGPFEQYAGDIATTNASSYQSEYIDIEQ